MFDKCTITLLFLYYGLVGQNYIQYRIYIQNKQLPHMSKKKTNVRCTVGERPEFYLKVFEVRV
jgi:hypothetical protein